jgi:hypothetical protein
VTEHVVAFAMLVLWIHCRRNAPHLASCPLAEVLASEKPRYNPRRAA